MATQGTTGVKCIVRASGFSWQGLQAACKNEAAFRQEFMLVIILAPLGLWLGKSGVAKALLVSVLLLVLVVELLNSAIEAVFVALMNVIIARTLVLFGQV